MEHNSVEIWHRSIQYENGYKLSQVTFWVTEYVSKTSGIGCENGLQSLVFWHLFNVNFLTFDYMTFELTFFDNFTFLLLNIGLLKLVTFDYLTFLNFFTTF